MSLSDELAKLTRHTVGCTTCRWLSEQSEKHRAEFDACVKEKVSAAALHAVCREYGLNVSVSAFRTHLRDHHRKGES